MKKYLLFSIVLLCYNVVFCQSVAINTDGSTPNPSAILDIKSTIRGFLMPRMTTLQRNAIATPAAGLKVYDTDTKTFWFYNSAAWVEISTGSNGWNLTGNSVTNPATHFIGTTDEQPLRFRVNNLWAGEIHPASGNLFLGIAAGQSNTAGEGNTATGDHSLFANTDGTFNTANGSYTLASNTTGYNNTAIGSYALTSNSTGNSNIAIGRNTLFVNTTGNNNTANGVGALFSNTAGNNNTANGNNALYSNTTGSFNTANGISALYANTTGFNNVAIGWLALSSNNGGSRNTAMGDLALSNNTNGDNNTAIGYSAFSTGNLLYNNSTAIGNNAPITASNMIRLGDGNVTTIGGAVNWTVLSDARLKVNVNATVPGLDFILKLRPVTYNIDPQAVAFFLKTPDSLRNKESEKTKANTLQTGFIAQEVELAAKKIGYNFSGVDTPKNENDYYGLRYAEFTVPLVKAMQEQQGMIENQQKQIDLLEKRIAALEAKK